MTLRDVNRIDANNQFLVKIGLNFIFKRIEVLAGQQISGQYVHCDDLLVSAPADGRFANDQIFFIYQKTLILPAFFEEPVFHDAVVVQIELNCDQGQEN